MSDVDKTDWDPCDEAVSNGPIAAYDKMREHSPVAYSERLGWAVFRHEDVVRILNDHDSFSNVVSAHVAVPNGMDPPEHTAYRRIVDRYFTPDRMASFEPTCRAIVTHLMEHVIEKKEVEWVSNGAVPFAARVQCAFLGWPPHTHELLARWAERNHAATRTGDRQAISEVARQFERFIDDRLEVCRRADTAPDDDITADLLQQKVEGRILRNKEIASILRNWTVGEIGTIAAATGILAHYLATHPSVQEQCRTQPDILPETIDEILRLHGPLAANRRVTKCPVEIGGRKIEAGERLSLLWISANRDRRVFENPEECQTGRDSTKNLLYGAGIHVCPGAPLARMELRVLVEEMLNRTTRIATIPDRPPSEAVYPESGFSYLPLRFE